MSELERQETIINLRNLRDGYVQAGAPVKVATLISALLYLEKTPATQVEYAALREKLAGLEGN